VDNGWNTLVAWFFAFLGIIAVVYVIAALLFIIPTWRILRRAGFAGALSLLHLVPVLGTLIVMAILAFVTWPAGEAQPEQRAP
jgi:hypothetical protein